MQLSDKKNCTYNANAAERKTEIKNAQWSPSKLQDVLTPPPSTIFSVHASCQIIQCQNLVWGVCDS